MFGLLGDLASGLGKIIGVATGVVIGIPLQVVATTLGFTVEMVKEAMEAGCETYEEIKDFWDGRY
jgi:hypothetical protein